MIEKNGVNQVLEKHEETRSDDYWKKIIEAFKKYMEMKSEWNDNLNLKRFKD